MTILADIISVFKSVEFLEKYETDEERMNAVKEIQSNALSFFSHTFGYAILVCLFVALVKLKLWGFLY